MTKLHREKTTTIVGLKVSDKQKQYLKKRAKRLKITLSDLISLALDYYLGALDRRERRKKS
jgi:hypothetical protein